MKSEFGSMAYPEVGANLNAICWMPTFIPLAPFNDVPKNHWAAEAVERLRQEGLLRGVGGGRFGQ